MNPIPAISVILPVRNGGRYVRAALDSVLEQEQVSLEVVVVDDGSTDGTRAAVEAVGDERVRVVNGPEQGVAAAMNVGLEAARGLYLARCDSDDRFAPGRLAAQMALLESRREFGAVCGRFEVLDGGGRPVHLPMAAGERARELTSDLRDGRVDVHLCTYLMRREPVMATGGFRSYFRTGSDIDFQLLLCEQTRVWYEPATWYGYRFHDDSLTHRQARRLKQFNEAMARRFQRQRVARGDGKQLGKDDLQLGHPPAAPDGTGGEGERCSAQEQLWQMRWAEAWHEHARGRRAKGMRMGLRTMLQQPWRPEGWRGFAALCVKSTPLWRGVDSGADASQGSGEPPAIPGDVRGV